MRILLDTHVLLWLLARPSRLPPGTRKRIASADAYVSAASIWEIGIKARLGKLRADADEILSSIEPAGFSLLPVSGEHAARVAHLPPLHRDPFDRMLVAQCLVEPMILVTNDVALTGYGPFVTLV